MLLAVALLMAAQQFSQRGFVETRATAYPQAAINDSARFVGGALARYEGFYRPKDYLQVAGALDFRTDSHHETERDWRISWQDRETLRPLASLRRLSATAHRGPLTLEAGKQFVRWGKADIVNPTDRFAPRDFINVIDTDFLAVTALRATLEKGSHTLDAVWSPRFTPSRIPLLNHRWFPGGSVAPVQTTSEFPGGSEVGLRWSYTARTEFSVSYYDGRNHGPSFEPVLAPGPIPSVKLYYPRMRMFGGDVAVPLPWFTLKMETAYFTSPDPRPDQYAQLVIQAERSKGEWLFIGGYAGEAITRNGLAPASFDPERGVTRTFLGKTTYAIDANRNVAVEVAVRQNGGGSWTRFEYSQTFGQHWRITPGFAWIRGRTGDFMGQFRRNSHAQVAVRYSF